MQSLVRAGACACAQYFVSLGVLRVRIVFCRRCQHNTCHRPAFERSAWTSLKLQAAAALVLPAGRVACVVGLDARSATTAERSVPFLALLLAHAC
jgi:hypothetical protein